MTALGDNVEEGEGDQIADTGCSNTTSNSTGLVTLLAAAKADRAVTEEAISLSLSIKEQPKDQVQRLRMRQRPAKQVVGQLSAERSNLLFGRPPNSRELRLTRRLTSFGGGGGGGGCSKHRVGDGATSFSYSDSSNMRSDIEFESNEEKEKEGEDEDGGENKNFRSYFREEFLHANDYETLVEAAKVRAPNKWRAQPLLERKQLNNYSKQKSINATYKLIKKNQLVLARLSRSSSSSYSSANNSMWPTWRKIVILSFLSVLLASLLANLNVFTRAGSASSSSSTCLLFNQCHALSVRQTVTGAGFNGNSSELSTANAAVGTNGDANDSAGQQMSSQRPKLSAILMPSTTISTASVSAPTSLPVSTQSSVALIHQHHHHSNTNQEMQPMQNRYHQQRQLTQLNNSNKTNAASSRDDEANLLDLSGHNNNGALKFSPFNNNYHHQENGKQQQHRAESGNDAAAAAANNNNNNNGSQKVSSITRSDFSSGRSEANGEELASSPTSNKRHRQQQQQQHNHQTSTATNSVPIQSSRGSINRLMASSASQTSLPVDNVGNDKVGRGISLIGKFEQKQQRLDQQQPRFKPMSNPKETSSPVLNGWSVIQQQFSSGSNPVSVTGEQQQQQEQQWRRQSLIASANNMASNETARVEVVLAPKRTGERSQYNNNNNNVLPPISHTSADSLTHKADQIAADHQAQLSMNTILNKPVISSQTHLNTLEGRNHDQPSRILMSNIEQRPEQQQQQFLVSAGLAIPPSLLQSLVKSALADLVANTAAGEQILGAASHAQPLVFRGPLKGLNPLFNFGDPPTVEQQLAALQLNENTNSINNKQAPKTAASASAPSISLPPLSHFLVPRNPFRLFSSSSTPIATRYRPSFMAKSASKLVNKSLNTNKAKPAQSAGVTRWTLSSQPAATDMSASIQLRAPAYQAGHLFGLDDILSTAADSAGQTGSLYAHSHSAEQLERLVRAASQASGVHSPILPAIVSAPNGAFPGFYIPAVESESESQVNELLHGAPSSTTNSNDEQSHISSKIPGTDYILHPDEMRAMINIGELAWQKQQTDTDTSNKQHQAASSNHLFGVQPLERHLQQQQQQQQQYNHQDLGGSISESRGNWRFLDNQQPTQQFAFPNLMRENHAENARDFAYVDPQTRHDQFQSASHSSAFQFPILQQQQQQQQQSPLPPKQQPQQQTYRPNSTLELANQLSQHFRQNQLSSFPAIIRVNDQDYVHWPLIKLRQAYQGNQQLRHPSSNPTNAAEESRKLYTQLGPYQPAGLYQAKITPYQRGHLFAVAASPSQLSLNKIFQHQQPTINNNDHRQPSRQQASNLNHPPHYSFGDANNRQVVNSFNQMAANQQVSVRATTPPSLPLALTKSGLNAPQTGATVQTQQSVDQSQVGPTTKLRSNLPDLDHSPVRLATQLTPHEVRQVEDSIIEALLLAQTLQQQRHLIQGINNRQSPAYNEKAISSSSANNNNNIEQLEEAGSSKKSKLKTSFLGRRRRRHSNAINKQANKRRTQTLVAASSEPFGNFISTVPMLNVSSLSLQILPPTMLQFSHLDLMSSHSSQLVPDDGSLSLKPKIFRLPVVMADQETNRPNLLHPLGISSSVSKAANNVDSMSVESSAPKATLLRPSNSRTIAKDGQSTMAFGSRVSRLNSAAPVDHQETFLKVLTDTNRHSQPTAANRQHQFNVEGPPPVVVATAKSNLIELIPANKQTPTRAASSINRINVDWPAMVSDADYFPDPNEQRNHPKISQDRSHKKKPAAVKAEQQLKVPGKQQQQPQQQDHSQQAVQVSAESRQVLDGGPTSGTERSQQAPPLNNYVPSQLKLQFAQDYQAREGVPIYNNNVRLSGAIDRERSLPASSSIVRDESRSSPHHHNNQLGSPSNRLPQTKPESIKPTSSDSDEDPDLEETDEVSPADEPALANDLQSRGSQVARQVAQPIITTASSTRPISISIRSGSGLNDTKPVSTLASNKTKNWQRESLMTNKTTPIVVVGPTKKSDAH